MSDSFSFFLLPLLAILLIGCDSYVHVQFDEPLSIAEVYSISQKNKAEILWMSRPCILSDGIKYAEEMYVEPGMTASDIEQVWTKRRDRSLYRQHLLSRNAQLEFELSHVDTRVGEVESRLQSVQQGSRSNRNFGDELSYLNSLGERLMLLRQQREDELVQTQSTLDSLDGLSDSTYSKSITLDHMLVKLTRFRGIEQDSRISDTNRSSDLAVVEAHISQQINRPPYLESIRN